MNGIYIFVVEATDQLIERKNITDDCKSERGIKNKRYQLDTTHIWVGIVAFILSL